MSDTLVESDNTQTSDTSAGVEPAPPQALGATDTLRDSLTDPLADSDGDVQFFANGLPDDDAPARSLRSVKQDIQYLSEDDGASLLDAVLSVQLARYRYIGAAPETSPRLGFIIDDLPSDSPALATDGAHVDTYGFTSMAVAALQSQQRQIDTLRAQLAALSARLEALERSEA